MRLVITGGTGLVGSLLLPRLAKEGHTAVVLTRREGPARMLTPSAETEHWDCTHYGPWANRLERADAVVNLAGESLAAGRWTSARKRIIIDSRVNTTATLVEAMRRANHRPSILVNASAVGYYGSVEEGDVTERHPEGSDFLAGLCLRWEQEAKKAEELGVRVVLLRFGMILDRNATALRKLAFPFRLFAGGWLGSGRQWLPWIHGEDIAGLILFAIQHSSLSGPVNAAAPEGVRMKEFCKTLGSVMRRPCWAAVPEVVLRAALGEMAGMVLTGQKVVPERAVKGGYVFRFPTLRRSLESILLYPPS